MNIAPGKTVVGWIGTGIMGAAMAGHVQRGGYALRVHNRTRAKAEPLLAASAGTAPDHIRLQLVLGQYASARGQNEPAIAAFRRYRINMTKIESRPSKRKAWEYFFFVDCDGHLSDRKVARALVQLGEHCDFVKVLGSYPRTD